MTAWERRTLKKVKAAGPRGLPLSEVNEPTAIELERAGLVKIIRPGSPWAIDTVRVSS